MQERNSTGNGWLWPLWGVAAGVLGYIGHMFTQTTVTEEERASGVAVMNEVTRGGYHVGVVAGLLAVFCLLVLAAGWWRWANANAPTSIASAVVTLGMTASAGAMILGYGIKGMLAIYLPGGINENTFPMEGLYTLFMFDDLAPFVAWYGVTIAAAALVWLSLREGYVAKWIGLVSILFVLVPLGFLVGTGLSGFPGIVQPLWLIVVGIGMALSLRRSPARAIRSNVAPAMG